MPKPKCLPCLIHGELTSAEWTLILEALEVQMEAQADQGEDEQWKEHNALQLKIRKLRRIK